MNNFTIDSVRGECLLVNAVSPLLQLWITVPISFLVDIHLNEPHFSPVILLQTLQNILLYIFTNIVINIKMSFVKMNSFEFELSIYTPVKSQRVWINHFFWSWSCITKMSSACFEVILNRGYRPIKEFIDFAPINTFQEMFNVYNFVLNSVWTNNMWPSHIHVCIQI